MKKIYAPTDDQGWKIMVSSILKANLNLANMNYTDLSKALEAIGVIDDPKHISAKLVRGSFSAVFFLQVLSVIGAEQLHVPQIKEDLTAREHL